jgi:hypothetical protein
MKRIHFALGSCASLLVASRGVVAAQITLDLVPALIKVRARAENDIKQVHLLAKYAPSGSSPLPFNIVAIDGRYDDLVATVNGYLQGLAAAILLPRALDDKKWTNEGNIVVAQATKFDDSLEQLKKQLPPSENTGSRTPLLSTLATVIGQIIMPGSTIWGNTKKQIDQDNADNRKRVADVLQTALWRDSATVLGPQPTDSPRTH